MIYLLFTIRLKAICSALFKWSEYVTCEGESNADLKDAMRIIYKYLRFSFDSSLYDDVKQPTRCNKFRLLILLNQLYMFRETNSPILRSTFRLYIQLLVQCTDIAADRSVAISVHCTKSCIYSQKVLLRMGEFVDRNM